MLRSIELPTASTVERKKKRVSAYAFLTYVRSKVDRLSLKSLHLVGPHCQSVPVVRRLTSVQTRTKQPKDWIEVIGLEKETIEFAGEAHEQTFHAQRWHWWRTPALNNTGLCEETARTERDGGTDVTILNDLEESFEVEETHRCISHVVKRAIVVDSCYRRQTSQSPAEPHGIRCTVLCGRGRYLWYCAPSFMLICTP